MTTTDQAIEQAIQQAGADKAPRVTPADIEANIASEHYFTAADGVNGANWVDLMDPETGVINGTEAAVPQANLFLVTFCVLTTKNGTKLVGVNEGPVSPENFNAELGRSLARQKAIDQLWPLMGYALRDRLVSEAK